MGTGSEKIDERRRMNMIMHMGMTLMVRVFMVGMESRHGVFEEKGTEYPGEAKKGNFEGLRIPMEGLGKQVDQRIAEECPHGEADEIGEYPLQGRLVDPQRKQGEERQTADQ